MIKSKHLNILVKKFKNLIDSSLTSLLTGVVIIGLFYNLSSNLKNIYLDLKNNYTSDDKYLAVITNNGLWIKDNVMEKTNIINASKIDGKFLIEASITELDKDFNVIKHIETDKIDISNNNWRVLNPKIFSADEKNEFNQINFNSNFDYERIQSLFSNLSSLSIIELFQLKKNYNSLNLSTTEIRLQIQKILSFPFYLCLMSILASVIMYNFKIQKQYTKNFFWVIFVSINLLY